MSLRDTSRLMLVLGFALAFYIWIAAPGLTWVNTNSDSSIYLASAQRLIPSHPTGAPLFNLLNYGVLRALPFGDEAWRLALVAAIAAALTSALLFLHTKSLIAPAIYMASGLVASQASIIETYSLVTLLMVAMYVWRERPYVVVATAILGIGVHHLIGLTLIPVMAWYFFNKRSLKPFLLLPLASLWYLYLPLTYNEGSIWVQGNSIGEWRRYMTGQSGLVLGLAVVSKDLWIRIVDIIPLLLGGFLAALVPIALRARNDLLTWCFILPVAHYFGGLPHVAFVYMMPAFAFGGIMAHEWIRDNKATFPMVAPILLTFAVIQIGVNAYSYDVGGHVLDKNKTAERFRESLEQLPNGAVIWTYNRGWEWVTATNYAYDNDIEVFHPQVIFEELDTIGERFVKAEIAGKLYHSVLTDAATYESHVEPTTIETIWPDVVKQYFWPKTPDDYPLPD